MLIIRDLRHQYGKPEVLRSVSLELPAGEILCLLGPSGCGKTTLLRLAAGIEHCQHGQIELDGTIVADGASKLSLPPEARQIGMMFQEFALFPHLTVLQNMMFGVRTKRADRTAWINETASRMGVGALLGQYPGTLSGGQQQRVALIRALAPEPRVLLLDEPFSGLDAVRRADVREQTQALVRESGIAALMVTHDPEEAMFMADRIAVMNNGEIVQSGTPDEVYFAPRSAFVASLFGHLNELPASSPLVSQQTYQCDTVVLRPDNLQEVPAGTPGSAVACINGARRLGSEVQLNLSLPQADKPELKIQARWPATKLPAVGTDIYIKVRHPEQVFGFCDNT